MSDNGNSRTTVDPTPPEEVEPMRLTTTRLVRWATVLGVGILTVLVLWQDPSYAA